MAFHTMNQAEVRAFLTALPARTGKLATVRPDGRPHVAPIWFDVDDDDSLVFNTGATTVKGKNLAARGWAAICVDDEMPPFAFVTVEGPIEVSDDADEVAKWAARLGGRYMGRERAAEYGKRNAVPGELVVRLRPEHTISAADMAD